jgi:hypothetical protein
MAAEHGNSRPEVASPSHQAWHWPGAMPPVSDLIAWDPARRAAAVAIARRAPDPTIPGWVREIGRALDAERSDPAQSPFSGWICFPLDGGEAGGIGLLRLESSDAPAIRHDERLGDRARATIESVLRHLALLWLRITGERRTWVATVVATDRFDGESVGLAVAVAAVASLAGGGVAPDLAFSGGWDAERERLRPVDPTSLEMKRRAARQWGFRKLATVGSGGDIELPSLIEELPLRGQWLDAAAPGALAALLLAWESRLASTSEGHRERIERSSRLLESAERLLRLVALDIRSRAMLHLGRSGEARRDAEECAALTKHVDLPDGVFGDLLRERGIAHRSVAAMDAGLLEDDTPEHKAVDEAIDSLIRRHWLRTSERLVLHFLRHTRARRRLYLARLRGDAALARAALDEARQDRDRWPKLLDCYARKELGRTDTSSRRAENLVIECAATLEALDPRGVATEDWSDLWPARIDAEAGDADAADADLNGFDVAADCRWRRLADRAGLSSASERWIDGLRADAVDYPASIALEEAIRCVADDDPRRHRWLDHLSRSDVFAAEETSILRVVAVRFRSVLLSYGRPAPECPPPSEGLRPLFDAACVSPERAPY